MSSPLRGAEIDACVHRIALSRTETLAGERSAITPEQERRRRDAEEHRRAVDQRLRECHPDSVVSSGHQHTEELMQAGCEMILRPRLADRESARRSASVQALVRVGRTDERFAYAPLVVKNHEVTELAPARRLLEGSLERLLPAEVDVRDGIGLRSTATVRRDGLLLSGATRILQALGHGDPGERGILVDRNQRAWWLELGGTTNSRFNLKTYDDLYRERLDVLLALDEWFDVGMEFPTTPYWHRECLTCEFGAHCERQLDETDDVSLIRFTNIEQQRALREAGIHSRTALARLDPVRARQARHGNNDGAHTEDVLGRAIDKLDELIYRARSHVRSSYLRILDPDEMGCPTADVEIDVDMESFDDATYLWGAFVTLNRPVDDISAGYRPFVEWSTLNATSEAVVFSKFWEWFSEVREHCHDQGLSFAAYCFWAQAEDGAMNRAALTPVEGGPSPSDLDEFRRHSPVEWFDLHEIAKRQIQTEGPLGLKQLAGAVGFSWRDPNPSGEASMLWYEQAVSGGETELEHRQRLLEYNEDDCRATKALRDWLNGPAKRLAHRDDLV